MSITPKHVARVGSAATGESRLGSTPVAAEHARHAAETDRTTFGFWVYLMTDCILFASLFAAYFVLRPGTFGGPDGREIFSLPLVFAETLILLTSSFSCGLAVLASQANRLRATIGWLAATAFLGAGFLALEIHEFVTLIQEGYGPDRSGFLTGFFSLVGTHGLHISIGLIWIVALGIYILKRGFTPVARKRLTLFAMFWHFLDLVWIFIFSMVYLLGVL